MIISDANSIETQYRVPNKRLFITSTRVCTGSHYWLICCGTIPTVYRSGSSNCCFRFYQQNVLVGFISILYYINSVL